MSGGRTVAGLLIGIAALVGAHLALDVKTREAPRAIRRNALVPSAEKAIALSIVRTGGEAETRLVRTDGGGWKMARPYAADVEDKAVLRLSDALAFAPISDEMTDAELLRIGRTREDFGLDKPRLTVALQWPGEKVTAVAFGAATPAGDGVYATVGESDTVYVASSNVFAAADLDAAGFRRRRVFAVESEDVVAFDVKNGKGHFVRLVREDSAWKVAEPREGIASAERVRSFLDALVRLEAQGFVWPTGAANETAALSGTVLASYGLLDDSAVAVTLKCSDGKDVAIGLGSEAGRGTVYALAPGGSVVTVPAALRAAAVAGMDAFVDTRLFPLEAQSITAVSLDDGGKVYLLSRKPNAEWRLDAPVAAAADAETADALVGRLLALKSSDVDTNGVAVAVGTNAAPVAVSRTALLAGMRVEDLRSKDILKIDPKLAKRVVVTDRDKKPVAVALEAEKGAWAVESAEEVVAPDGEAIAALLAAVNPLRAIRVVRLKVTDAELGQFGLDKPLRTVAIDQTAEGSVRRNVLIGDVTDGGRYATLGASDAVFVISSESASALLAPVAK